MVEFVTNYISVGGNRHPSAADWNEDLGLLAYGADRNVALWSPFVGPGPVKGVDLRRN